MNKYVFTKEDRKLLIELICNEQTHMIIKDHTKYDSEKYKKLEELKVKIKDCEVVNIADITMCSSENCPYKISAIEQKQSRKNIKVGVILNILATKIADLNILCP